MVLGTVILALKYSGKRVYDACKRSRFSINNSEVQGHKVETRKPPKLRRRFHRTPVLIEDLYPRHGLSGRCSRPSSDRNERNYGRAPLNWDLVGNNVDNADVYGGGGGGVTSRSYQAEIDNSESTTSNSDSEANRIGPQTLQTRSWNKPAGDGDQPPIQTTNGASTHEVRSPVHPKNGTTPELKPNRRVSRFAKFTGKMRCCFGGSYNNEFKDH